MYCGTVLSQNEIQNLHLGRDKSFKVECKVLTPGVEPSFHLFGSLSKTFIVHITGEVGPKCTE